MRIGRDILKYGRDLQVDLPNIVARKFQAFTNWIIVPEILVPVAFTYCHCIWPVQGILLCTINQGYGKDVKKSGIGKPDAFFRIILDEE